MKVVLDEEGLKGRILKKLWWSIPQVAGALYQLPHHQQQPSPPVLHLHPSSPPPLMSHRQPPPAVAPTPDSAGRPLRRLPLISLGRGGPPRQGNDGEEDLHSGKQLAHHHQQRPPHPTDFIHVDEELVRLIIKDCESEDMCSCPVDDKENTRPIPPPSSVPYPAAAKGDTAGASLQDTAPKEDGSTGMSPASTRGQLDVSSSSSFRRPDFNSHSLFDPDLLAAFRRAVMEHALACEELRRKAKSAPGGEEEEEEEAQERGQGQGGGRLHGEDDGDQGLQEPPCKVPRTDSGGERNDVEEVDPLRGFELRCPPGGGDAVVLYTTSLRGIRKTFEDCNNVRFLLQSLRVGFYERDVSMHRDYRDELWHVLGGRTVPPRLFIRGRFVGGADEVLCLHEQGRLLPLMRGVPVDRSGGVPCRGCGGARFVMCGECSGSRKVMYYHGGGRAGGGNHVQAVNHRCPHCNENGLVVCALCCCRGNSGAVRKRRPVRKCRGVALEAAAAPCSGGRGTSIRTGDPLPSASVCSPSQGSRSFASSSVVVVALLAVVAFTAVGVLVVGDPAALEARLSRCIVS